MSEFGSDGERKQLVDEKITRLRYNLKKMQELYTKRFLRTKVAEDPLKVYFEWARVEITYNDWFGFSGKSTEEVIKDGFFTEQQRFFLGRDPYKRINFQWKFYLEKDIIDFVLQQDENLTEKMIFIIFSIASGYFNDAKNIKVGPIDFMAMFTKELTADRILIFSISPERVPRVENNKVIAHHYTQTIRFHCIVSERKSIDDFVSNYEKYIKDHPDRYQCFRPAIDYQKKTYAIILGDPSLYSMKKKLDNDFSKQLNQACNVREPMRKSYVKCLGTIHQRFANVRVLVDPEDYKEYTYDKVARYWVYKRDTETYIFSDENERIKVVSTLITL